MANLGKCLLFCLKYAVEMERLYDTDPPNTDGVPEPKDAILAKVKLVGDAACRDAADLLESCVPIVEDRFRLIAATRRRRTNLEHSWDLRISICAKRAKHKRFEVGIFLDAEESMLVPWLWCGGGQNAEGEVIRILGCGIKSRGLGYTSGCVGLSKIPIAVPENWEDPVDSGPLIEQVGQAFALFDEFKVKELIALASD